MERTTIYLPRDLRLYLRDAAQRAGRSQAEIIRDALETQRDAQPRRLPSAIGLFASDPSQPPLTKERVRADYHAHLDRKFGERRADP